MSQLPRKPAEDIYIDHSTFARVKRWMYRGQRPNWVARIANRAWVILATAGVRSHELVTLEVSGRVSGRVIAFPLVMATVDGQCYLVAMLGEDTQWVKNVRATGGKAVLRAQGREAIELEELAASQRAPILKAYLQRAEGARPHIPIDKDAPLAEFELIAAAFPVFRVHRLGAATGQPDRVRQLERVAFKYANTFIMVPLLRTGLGRLIGGPASGYFLLLRTTGRKSGLPRETPLNYAIDEGAVVCLAGFGEQAHWLKNIQSDPNVRVRLPDRVLDGLATRVADRAEARRLAVAVARNCGFALVFEHPRCLLMSDAELAAHLDGRPVVRIQPVDGPIEPGPFDPGGKGWLLSAVGHGLIALGAVLWLSRRAKRKTQA